MERLFQRIEGQQLKARGPVLAVVVLILKPTSLQYRGSCFDRKVRLGVAIINLSWRNDGVLSVVLS